MAARNRRTGFKGDSAREATTTTVVGDDRRRRGSDRRGDGLLGRYRRRPTTAVRNQLVERYRGMVEGIARGLAQRLPANIDVEDLTHAGIWGLIQALGAWRPERGSTFVAFMRVRVRGAMIDELRTMNYLPRVFRQRRRLRDQALERLRDELQREPSDAEVAASLGMSENRYRQRFASAMVDHGGQTPLTELGEDRSFDDFLVCGEDGPMESADRRDLLHKIQRSLQPIEWRVLQMHYLDGLSGKEVARRLRLSPARICQIHGRVLARLKVRLRDDR